MAYDPTRFEASRRAAQGTFASQSAMNEYARFLANQSGARQLGDFQRDVRKQLPRLTSGFGQRGLRAPGVRSGIFNKALQSFGGDVQRQQSRFQEDLANQERDFDLRQSGFQSAYEQSVADIEAEKAREIANAASGLLTLGL